MGYRICFLVGMLILGFELQAQELQINELMSSNVSVITDEDGEYVDWVEVYNPSGSAIHLGGFGLSDDTLQWDRWKFPGLTIEPDGYLLVYCSGKDRIPGSDYFETVIRQGDQWSYRLGDSEPPADWNAPGFEDAGWSVGPSGFGYGDDDDQTEVEQTLSLYTRKTFTVEDTSVVSSAILNIDFDDAFVAYLNGTEVARSHIGTTGIPPAFDDTGELHEAGMHQGLDPETFEIDHSLLAEGSNVLAIQVHNEDWGSSDMTLIPYLTLVLQEPPDTPLGSPPELNFSGTGLHTSFKLSAGGETLLLSDSSGILMDSVSVGPLPGDISFWEEAWGIGTWLYFEEPTPGAQNGTMGIDDITDGEVGFAPSVKFFEGTISVTLSGSPADGIIRYTTDGSEPGVNDTEYTVPIEINTTTIIRARIFQEGNLPGKVSSYNYIDLDDIDADNIPVIAISTDPYNLYNDSDGLWEHAENRELEKPAHFEFIEPDGSVGFSIDAGLKIFGNEPSGGNHQHKLSIFARSKYGYGSINYHLFPDKPIEKFESLILRNEISDLWDVMASRLIDEEAVANQSYRPTIVFINGEYWGTKFIREKINEHFVASNFGVNPDSVDVIMGIESPVELYNEEWPIAGDLEDYKLLVHYLLDHDLSDPDNYEYVSNWIDMHNFITYQASEIYFGNIDWPGNNMKWWRERNDSGIWRWILFDVDAGMGAWEGSNYNSMIHATKPDLHNQWPNPPWSTLILRTLLENQTFRDRFISRSFDLLSTDFTEERVNHELDILVSETKGEIRNHMRRWNHGSYGEWEDWVADLRQWSRYRAIRVRTHIQDYFDLGTMMTIDLDCDPPGGGQIQVNSKRIELFPWEGKYTEELPIDLTAFPAYGYKFAGWDGVETSDSAISITMEQSVELTARFEPESWYEPIVINEINYHSAPGSDSDDWLELYNNGTESVDLTNWEVKDSEDIHVFRIPPSKSLAPGEYLVVSRERNLFSAVHPEVQNVIGDMGFGFGGGGEMVRLFNASLELIDWVEYDDFTPWPLEPDGTGATLALSHPDLDNAQAQSWFASVDAGTPGLENGTPGHTGIDQEKLKELKVQEPWPNPFKDVIHISYRVDEPGMVQVAIFDLQGRIVEALDDRNMSPGEYTSTWHGAGHDPGVYFCVIRTATQSVTRKLILMD